MIDKCKSCWNYNDCSWYHNHLTSEFYSKYGLQPIRCPTFLEGEDEEMKEKHEEITSYYFREGDDTVDGIR